jgi:hypothetical protein
MEPLVVCPAILIGVLLCDGSIHAAAFDLVKNRMSRIIVVIKDYDLMRVAETRGDGFGRLQTGQLTDWVRFNDYVSP